MEDEIEMEGIAKNFFEQLFQSNGEAGVGITFCQALIVVLRTRIMTY